ncbi:helix-turn-helix transcriptional regulator [Treponema bryantii]|uniref:helix-turn-helix transcriptional regulator n=1 Tax=Treponema bryantii TaxID=163 RepID=UPI002B28A7AB|nr:hypothetical protein TRBR_27030 [Treponema bryantii]
MNHTQKVLINNLRYYRNQLELTQSQFAELIDVSTNYYNALENGKYFPSVEVIDKICNATNLFPYQLFLENPYNNLQEVKILNKNISRLKNEILRLFNEYS